ncbi:hypothetical protein NQZ79_g1350 [Umbelopsis isabellina]|nr:hypothetical protein NQZ79_g1350 [Umbelopsis isabellina]
MYPEASFHGYVASTQDVLLIFEACRRGILPKIHRRLQDKERGIIQSGAIFVFDEHDSGIKRWTDGYNWSPSRILGNFLIYREVHKKSDGRKGSNASITDVRDDITDYTPIKKISKRKNEKRLVGSLSESYNYKQDGLIKKSMSIKINGVSQHLISYYYPEEVENGTLRTPSAVPELAELEISPEFLREENFRVPPMVEPTSDHDLTMPSTPTMMPPHIHARPFHNLLEDDIHQHSPPMSQPRSNHHTSYSLDHEFNHRTTLPPFRSMSLGNIYSDHHAVSSPRFPMDLPTFPPTMIRNHNEDQHAIKHEVDQYPLSTMPPNTSVHPYLPTSTSFTSSTIPTPMNNSLHLPRIEDYEHRPDVY